MKHGTLHASRSLKCEQLIYGQYMIFLPMVTFLDGALMVGSHAQYACVTVMHLIYVMAAKHVGLIAIGASYLEIMNSDLKLMHLERIRWCMKSPQESSKNSEDTAQNRGGSRNFSETQQLLEHNFGLEKGSTINTYAVMKSGYKIVDSTGRSGPIPSQKAQRRLDDYKELASDENSHELDGKALYTMGRGMKHGRVPIGDGAVDKETILVHRLSVPFKPVNPDDYERVIKENEQLKQTNQILHDENGVNRALIMAMYADFGKEPPAELLSHLENIDARRQQNANMSCSSEQVASC
ncbi:uncharacterized protein LOC120695723 isoform X2 [Panicum virgatum]|nr:uncharacterized protein LOC120695723 isoform X2 [Panicum virgatum]